MSFRQKVLSQRRCVRQALQYGVQETGIVAVYEAGSNTAQTDPLELQLPAIKKGQAHRTGSATFANH